MYARDRRKHLVNTIFMDGFYKPDEMEQALDAYLFCMEDEHEEADDEALKRRFYLLKSHMEELDALINSCSKGWRTDRMDPVVLAILRVAIYEMTYEDLTPAVAINEAVELGKVYGGTGSYALINGILAQATKEQQKEG